MKRIASPAELSSELRNLLAYSASPNPSRTKMATRLREMATRLAGMERMFAVYANPDTSEVSEEFGSLAEALCWPATPKAEIIRNGVTMAVAMGRRWQLTAEGLKAARS